MSVTYHTIPYLNVLLVVFLLLSIQYNTSPANVFSVSEDDKKNLKRNGAFLVQSLGVNY